MADASCRPTLCLNPPNQYSLNYRLYLVPFASRLKFPTKIKAQLIGNAGDLHKPVVSLPKGKRDSCLSVLGKSLLISGVPTLGSVEVAFSADDTLLNGIYDVSEAFEFGIQLFYLGALLTFLGVGTFFVVRQILIRRELENAAKELQERVRTGQATAVEYFELGAVMLRKKFYPLATKYLEQAIQKWEGDAQELAQVHNALGFCYASDGKLDQSIGQFEKAVELQPGYVTAWNNMADAYEKKKDLKSALKAYDKALIFDPNNQTARSCRENIQRRLELLEGIPKK